MNAKQSEKESRTRSFLRGVGSVVDLFPSTRFEKFVPKKIMEERMTEDWIWVGQSISTAMINYEKTKAQNE